jgi:hypothetical protein
LKNLLLALLAVSLPANSAEFVFKGSTVKSAIKINEAKCKGFSILVKKDRFPNEVENHVPAEVALKGFFGSDLIVGATAFLKIASTEYEIPVSVEKYQKKGILLNDGRAYIPSLGYCLDENAFLLSVWSGGNCNKCELLIKYRISPDGRATEVGLPSQEEFNKALGR